jgi:hypothetical protein
VTVLQLLLNLAKEAALEIVIQRWTWVIILIVIVTPCVIPIMTVAGTTSLSAHLQMKTLIAAQDQMLLFVKRHVMV